MRTPRVTQVVCSAVPEIGGPFRVMDAISRRLSSPSLSSEFEFSQICFGDSSGDIKNSFSHLTYKTIGNNRYGVSFHLLSQNIREKLRDSDLILLHGFYLLPTLFAALSLRRSAALAIMPHGSLDVFQEKESVLIKKCFKTLFNFFLQKKKLVFFCASETERSQILSVFPSKEVIVVGLGTDYPENFDNSLKPDQTSFSLVYLGRIHQKKNLEGLILSMKLLENFPSKLTLQVYGAGEENYIEELKLLALSQSLTDSIEFKGFIDGKEKYEVLQKADLFLLPSHNENFAIAVAEAILASTPVIVSKNVAMSEFVIEHGAGLVLKDITPNSIADAIREAYSDLPKLNSSCLESRELLLWDNVFPNWLKAIRDLT